MKICYFGSYDKDYSRNRINIKGFKKNKIAVAECNATGLFITRYISLLKQYVKINNSCSAIIVGFPGWYDVPLSFVIAKIFKKKLFFDIFVSTYETYVLDRKIVAENSLRAKFYFALDWLNLKLADFVITDTVAHKTFYQKLYGIKSNKFIVVYLGSDSDYFFPKQTKLETDVLFYGSYQPLQGVETIIKAAAKIPEIKFKLIGEGQERASAEKLAKMLKLRNVEFVDWVNLKKLSDEIRKAKICLGIFGASDKADVVIPNKVYDSMASKKPVITKKTKAIKELFSNSQNIILCKKNNPKELSREIHKLLLNQPLSKKISNNGFKFYNDWLKPELVVKPLVKFIYE